MKVVRHSSKRRNFLKGLGGGLASMPFLGSLMAAQDAHAQTAKEQAIPNPDSDGYLSMLQGPTSDSEALFNVFVPRLKNYKYKVFDTDGSELSIELYEVVKGPAFFHIHKLHVTGLALGRRYSLKVFDGKSVVDERSFSALDVTKQTARFALVSCSSDHYYFEKIIDPMWNQLKGQSPDFIILNGDSVYVDTSEFVERKKATELDIWQRYIDAFRRMPLYHWRELIPVFSTWDDHDFGTNDGDREFQSKDSAAILFRAIFGGKELSNTWVHGPGGVSSMFSICGQRFYLMDDRSFRQPNKAPGESEQFGHWGQAQHQWLIESIASDSSPAWIINGNQCFNGQSLEFKEAFEANHPREFVALIEQLATLRAPVVFASGDVHLSEIMQIPKVRMGYETYEITSSCMHSFLGDGWENPMRLRGAYCNTHNFMIIQSAPQEAGLRVTVKCMGLEAQPYFEKILTIKK